LFGWKQSAPSHTARIARFDRAKSGSATDKRMGAIGSYQQIACLLQIAAVACHLQSHAGRIEFNAGDARAQFQMTESRAISRLPWVFAVRFVR
jgi:hypothetical protein